MTVTGDPSSQQQTRACERGFDPLGRRARSEALVQRDRQDELAMHGGDAEAVARELTPDGALRQHAVRLHVRPENGRRPAADRLQCRGAQERRVVEHDALPRDAAQLADATRPVGRVHQHAQAHRHVERAGSNGSACASAGTKVTDSPRRARPLARDAQHLAGGIDAGDACRRARRAPGPRARCRCRRRARHGPRARRRTPRARAPAFPRAARRSARRSAPVRSDPPSRDRRRRCSCSGPAARIARGPGSRVTPGPRPPAGAGRSSHAPRTSRVRSR